MFAKQLAGRVMPFDAEAADVFANQRLMRALLGHSLAVDDGTILAIASTQAAPVVTGEGGGFARCEVAIMDL